LRREKWIHNITKRFDEDLHEDKIGKVHQTFVTDNQHPWLKEADEHASSSSDPLASLLFKVIEGKEDQGETIQSE
jgi:hypothetical protein